MSQGCTGPLVWHDVPAEPGRWEAAAILECSCGWFVTTGNLMDAQHAGRELLRSPQ